MRHALPQRSLPAHESGTALVLSLVLLVVLTFTGLAAARESVLQELMAAATRDRNIAFQAAESALREAEGELQRLRFGCGAEDVVPPPGGSHQIPLEGGGFLELWDEGAAGLPDPWDADSWERATAYSGSLAGIEQNPRYTVQVRRVSGDASHLLFTVTAAGTATRNTRAVVEGRFRRSFDRVVRIRGRDAVNVVAIGDGVLSARAQIGADPAIEVTLGGWDPDACPGGDEPITLLYEGDGGVDTFVVADLVGLGYAPGVNAMLDVTADYVGLESALSNYRIERILVENRGSTAVAISTLNASGRFTEDNHYCINTEVGDAGEAVLNRLVADLVGGLLPATPLNDLLDGVAGVGKTLIGSGGVLPVLPANASIILDGGGNDTYEVYTDTTNSAMLIADLGGNDRYFMRATGDGFLNLPVIVDVGGSDSYDIEGGSYLRASLDSGALADLDALLGGGSVSNLLSNLDAVLSLLFTGNCGGLISGLLCTLLNPLAALLDNILDTTGNLFDSQFHAPDNDPLPESEGRCLPTTSELVSWREVLR